MSLANMNGAPHGWLFAKLAADYNYISDQASIGRSSFPVRSTAPAAPNSTSRRVPRVYPSSAILAILASLASRKISNLCAFNAGSDCESLPYSKSR
jgi:hypothetical protein